MRNIIFGTVAGLLIGSVGALAYSHYMGDGGLLADLQSQLDAANAKLAKSQSDQKFLKEENNSITDQLNQVLASKQQGGTAAAPAGDAAAAPAAGTPLTIGGTQITPDMVRGFMAMMRGGPGGGFRSPQQRLFLLQTRLKLDPDQAKAIQAAMDADDQARRDAFRQSRQNHQPVDQQALAAASTLDKTLSSVLSPSQQVQYQQVQSDEKQARAETTATQQVDNMMPLLQLTDDQKEKAMNALYQQQLSAPDAAAVANNPNPLGALAQQGQAMQAAMKQVLTPDQFTIYQQDAQAQGMANFGGRRNGGNGGGGNGGGGGPGQGQGQAPGAVATGNGAAAPATTSTSGTTTYTTNAASATPTDNSSSTNTPSATTNAASASAVSPPTN